MPPTKQIPRNPAKSDYSSSWNRFLFKNEKHPCCFFKGNWGCLSWVVTATCDTISLPHHFSCLFSVVVGTADDISSVFSKHHVVQLMTLGIN